MALMIYDDTRDALFCPENRATVFGTRPEPSLDALAVEAARLAYIRAESSPAHLARLTAELRKGGFAKPTIFCDRGPGFTDFFSSTGSEGYATIRPSDGLAVIAFRGTQADRIRDLLTDISALKNQDAGWPGAVHMGFSLAAIALWPAVKIWLEATAGQRKSLLICGHSLGGAIATLVAMKVRPDRLVTLGSPRVGDDTFATALAALGIRTVRIVNSLDVVTRVPRQTFGFRHVGNAVFIAPNGQCDTAPTADQVDSQLEFDVLLQIAGGLFGKLPRDLSDHAPANYLRGFWP